VNKQGILKSLREMKDSGTKKLLLARGFVGMARMILIEVCITFIFGVL